MAETPAAPVPNGVPDFQTAIQILSAVAREKGDDFRVKILRKASPSAPFVNVATFDGARVDHFLTPEAWLVPFCGGGPIFVLWPFHASDPTKLVCQVIPPQINGTPKEPDLRLPASPTWNGPVTLISPKPPDAPAANPSADLAVLFPVSGAARQAGGPAREAGATTASTGGPGHSPSAEEDRLTALRLQIIDQQRRQDAERIEKLIAAQQAATDRQMAAIMGMVEKMNSAPRAPEKTLVEQIAALTPVLSVVLPFLGAAREKDVNDAKLRAEAEVRRQEREDKARDEMMKLIIGMNEKSANAGNETVKMIAPMVDAVAQMSRTSLQTAATMRELMPQVPEDEGIMGLVKALAPAVAEFLAVRAQNGQPPGAPPQGQLPAQTPPPSAGGNGQPAPSSPPEVDIASISADDLAARIDGAIRAHHDPNDLAAGYLDAITGNAGFAEKVRAAGGTWAYFKSTLAAWAVEAAPGADGKTNATYLREVAGVLKAAALARGITL